MDNQIEELLNEISKFKSNIVESNELMALLSSITDRFEIQENQSKENLEKNKKEVAALLEKIEQNSNILKGHITNLFDNLSDKNNNTQILTQRKIKAMEFLLTGEIVLTLAILILILVN